MTLTDILNNQFIAPLIMSGMTALGALVGRVLLEKWRLYRRELDENQQLAVERWAEMAVRWVEQTTTEGTPSNQKLKRASKWVASQCERRGFPVDPEFIEASVEAAVLGLTKE